MPHRAKAAHMSRMFLELCVLGHRAYNRGGANLRAVFPELMAAMAVTENDFFNNRPSSQRGVATRTGMETRSAGRDLEQLEAHNVVVRTDAGYTGNEAFLDAPTTQEVIAQCEAIVHACSDAMRALSNTAMVAWLLLS